MNNETVNDNFFDRLFMGVVIGCITGIIGGVLSGVVGSYIDWAKAHLFHEELHIVQLGVAEYLGAEIITMGIPLGLLIGIIIAFTILMFRISKIKPLIWALVGCLGIALGLRISHLSEFHFISQVALCLKVVFIGLITGFITGWAASKYYNLNFSNNPMEIKRLVIVSLLCDLFLIFISTYYYFELINDLRNIPS